MAATLLGYLQSQGEAGSREGLWLAVQIQRHLLHSL